MRSFERHLDAFNARRVRLLAVSVDPPEITRTLCRQEGYSFTFLSDVKSDVIRTYDLLHHEGGPDGGDIARPAEFLIDASGTIRWRNLTESILVRARPEQILDFIDNLGLSREPGS